MLSLVSLLLCYRAVFALFGYHYMYSEGWTKRPGTITVMSWNVHGMGIFNRATQHEEAKGITETIAKEDPDILIAPEFTVAALTFESPYKRWIIKNGRYKDFRFTSDNGLGSQKLLGTAIFSRFPIVNYNGFFLDPYIAIAYADVKLPGDKMTRVFTIHLHTFGLSDRDKLYIESVKQSNASGLGRSKSFLWKFIHAYRMRAAEADTLATLIHASPYPVIIAGDFNDLPYSYVYTRVKGKLEDAVAARGTGMGRTYNQIIPTLRIDYIMYDPRLFDALGFKTLPTTLSDHRPVLTKLRINP